MKKSPEFQFKNRFFKRQIFRKYNLRYNYRLILKIETQKTFCFNIKNLKFQFWNSWNHEFDRLYFKQGGDSMIQ